MRRGKSWEMMAIPTGLCGRDWLNHDGKVPLRWDRGVAIGDGAKAMLLCNDTKTIPREKKKKKKKIEMLIFAARNRLQVSHGVW